MILRFLYRELKNNKKFVILFILNMAIGLMGFITLDAFKRGFLDILQESSKNLQTSDISLSARRMILDEDLKKIVNTIDIAEAKTSTISLYTMVASSTRTGLVQLQSIEKQYPFYGHITLREGGTIKGPDKKKILDSNEVWLSPELLIKLSLNIGETIKIGNNSFTVADVVDDDTSASFYGAATIAPRVYISNQNLLKTGLVTEGSTLSHSIHYKVKNSVDLKNLAEKLIDKLDDPTIRVRTYHDTAKRQGRVISYLSDYLGLVALVAFFLSAVGASYLFASYIQESYREIAILRSLGVTSRQAIQIYTYLLAILGGGAALVSAFGASFLLPILNRLLKDLVPVSLNFQINIESIAIGFAIGLVGALSICLPLIVKIREIDCAQLFNEQISKAIKLDLKSLLFLTPAAFGFWGLSIWQAHSIKIGSSYFLSMIVSIFIITMLTLLILKLLSKLSIHFSFTLKMAIQYITRSKTNSLINFTTIAMGTLLISIIPMLRENLLSEIKYPAGTMLPKLFMFDIQEEQIDSIKEDLSDMGVEKIIFSPMIRSRLIKINGEKLKISKEEAGFTREDQYRRRMRNRGINLSYRSELSPSEKVTAGIFFKESFDPQKNDIPEISIEEGYANRMELQLNNILTFEIQGIPFQGKVTSLRQVKWNSFQPNFFIQFQPGVLEDAPKTYLVSAFFKEKDKLIIQNKINYNFPNVSIIDVEKLVNKISELIDKMSFILNFMAIVSVLAGLFVLFSIATHQAGSRKIDINLIKILGAKIKTIFSISLLESLTIGLFATSIGATISIIVSYIIAHVILGGIWTFNGQIVAISIVTLLLLTLFATLTTVLKITKKKPTWV